MKKIKIFSIKYKIICSILLVFICMGSASIWSMHKLMEINKELDNLATIIIPVNDTIAKIEMELLKQQNIVSIIREEKEIEQLLENQKFNQILKNNHHEKLKNETNKFNTLSTQINIHINDEIQFIEKNLKQDILLTTKIKLNKILKLLNKIAKEHYTFHEYAHAFIVSDMKNLNEINKKSLQLEEIDNELIRHIDNIFKEIETFTQQSALTANQHEKDGIYITTIINIITGIIGIIIGTIIAKKIIQPLFHILNQVKSVENGNLSAKTNIKTNDELTILGKSFNNMVKELNDKETIKNIFGQYIDPRIVKRLIKTKNKKLDTPTIKPVCVFFSDISKFTHLSEKLTAKKLVQTINHYFQLMSKPIKSESGIIDKYIGDAIMAFWTEPFCNKK